MKAIDLSPKFADAHCNLGSVYRDGGQVVLDTNFYIMVDCIRVDSASDRKLPKGAAIATEFS